MQRSRLRRPRTAVRKQDVRPADAIRELGRSGLQHFGGTIEEEMLRQLRGERRNKAFREMRDNDAVVGAIFYVIEMLVRQVSWYVTPHSQDEEDVRRAEFLEGAMDDMSHSWNDLIAEALSMLQFGWSYHELVYKKRGGPLQKRPEMRSRYDDGLYGWRKIPGRAQETLSRWDLDETGGVRGMYQTPPPDYTERFIPIEKALLFRTTTVKGSPEGRSILRNAWRSYYFKKRMEEIEAIGIERDLAGLPVIYAPAEIMAPDATPEQKALLEALKDIVRNVRRDEQEGVILPSDLAERGVGRTIDLKLLSTGGSRQFNTNEIITRYDQRIAMTVLADFILLGHEKVGSFALSSSKTSLFAVALGTYLDIIAYVFNQFAIPRLFALNGWPLDRLPYVEHGDIETPDLKELGDYIAKLSGAGMELFPDDKLENALREAAGLPPKAEDDDTTPPDAADGAGNAQESAETEEGGAGADEGAGPAPSAAESAEKGAFQRPLPPWFEDELAEKCLGPEFLDVAKAACAAVARRPAPPTKGDLQRVARVLKACGMEEKEAKAAAALAADLREDA